MNIIYWINKIISSIVIVVLIIAFIKFITAYSKESSSSLKEYINKKLDTIFYFFYILFSVYGILNMITSLIEQYMNVSDSADIFNGFALLAFGITLFSISCSIQQTKKSSEEAAQLKEDINKNFKAIPQDNLKEPTMYIVGPAIEASKYYYEETQFKEMFAKLIAASCDERKNSKIHPYFIYAIKQLTPVDATILKTFKSHQKQAIVNYSFFYKDIDSENIDYPNVFYPFNKIEEPQKYAISITNLVRVGFITLNFSRYLTNEKLYDIYFSDPFYLESKKVLTSDSSNRDYIINKGTVTLTPLGENFIELCL